MNLKTDISSVGFTHVRGNLDKACFKRMKEVMKNYHTLFDDIKAIALMFESPVYRLEVLINLMSLQHPLGHFIDLLDYDIVYLMGVVLKESDPCKFELLRFFNATRSILNHDNEFSGIAPLFKENSDFLGEVYHILLELKMKKRGFELNRPKGFTFYRQFGLDIPPQVLEITPVHPEVVDIVDLPVKRVNIELNIFKACLNGDLERVKHYIATSEWFNVKWVDYQSKRTFLHAACIGKNSSVVSVILSLPGIDINALDWVNDSAFFKACKLGLFTMIGLFLRDPRVNVKYLHNKGDYDTMTFGQARVALEIMEFIILSGRDCNLGKPRQDIISRDSKSSTGVLRDIVKLVDDFEEDPVKTRLTLAMRDKTRFNDLCY
jgi:hypothetical protein